MPSIVNRQYRDYEHQDRVTMICGPYKGMGGFIMKRESKTHVTRSSVPAVVVWIWGRDVHVVTVPSHFRHHSGASHNRQQRRGIA
jgi:hypothetical protein